MDDSPKTPKILLCMRVSASTFQMAGSKYRRCSRCKEPVTISPSGQATIKAYPETEICCPECLRGSLKNALGPNL